MPATLIYATRRPQRFAVSVTGLLSLSVTLVVFLWPVLMAMHGNLMRFACMRPAFSTEMILLLDRLLMIEMSLLFLLPLAGLLLGLAGLAMSGVRCVVAGSAALFNGMLLAGLFAHGVLTPTMLAHLGTTI